jgi:hypothetical protein
MNKAPVSVFDRVSRIGRVPCQRRLAKHVEGHGVDGIVAAMAVLALGLGACDGNSNGADCWEAGGQCHFAPSLPICAVPGQQSCPQGPAFCCLHETADCGQPAAVIVACDGGAPVCVGTPQLSLNRPPNLPGQTNDTYGAGCVASMPLCNDGVPLVCTCFASGSPGLGGSWSISASASGAWRCVP